MTEPVPIGRRIRELAATQPDGVVHRHLAEDGTEDTFDWAALDRRSRQVAGALADRGVARGDRVALGMRNSPQLVLAILAAWKLGATPVTVRWDVPGWELERLLAVVGARVFLAAGDEPWVDATALRPPPDLPDVVAPQVHGICSGGSTGTPKVILSDRPGVFDPRYGTPIAEHWGPVARPQTILVPSPLYHSTGFGMLFGLLAGDRLVVMERFDAGRMVDAIERHRVTTFTATPTMLQRVADLPGIDERHLSSLVWITQGAAPMPPSLVHRWAGLIGAERLYMAYGMTEALGFTAIRADEWVARPGSVGRGIRGTEIRVLDGDGKDVPPGEAGEVYLRSPAGAAFRYLGDVPPPASTGDGFHSVGDLGRLDDDGFLYLLDRRVDMIVTGGANVYPAEVEAALVDHPLVADVVVIGLRDERWGRRVHAVVEPADPERPPAEDEVIAYARARLAPYKVPKTVELVAAMPRSEATKVNRRAMVDDRGG